MKTTCLLTAGLMVCGTFAGMASAEEQAKSLFNGKTLDGWSGNEKFWSVKDGAITGQTTSRESDQGQHLPDLEGGRGRGISNSSSSSRSSAATAAFSTAAPITATSSSAATRPTSKPATGTSASSTKRRAAASWPSEARTVVIGADGKKEVVGKTGDPKEIADSVKKEDWNEMVVIAKGNHLVQMINGYTTIDVTDNESSKAKASRHPRPAAPRRPADDRPVQGHSAQGAEVAPWGGRIAGPTSGCRVARR